MKNQILYKGCEASKKIRLSLLTAAILSFYSGMTQDQDQESGPAGNQYKGTIVNNEDVETNGIIETNLSYPWLTQKYIRFFDDSLLKQGERVRFKDKPKFDAKDIKGFRFEDRRYESHKYADLSSLGPKALGAFYFFEVVTDGPIKVLRFFESPPTIIQGDPETVYEELRNSPQLMVIKGESKLEGLSSAVLEKFISDCPEVATKYNEGKY